MKITMKYNAELTSEEMIGIQRIISNKLVGLGLIVEDNIFVTKS